MQVTGLSLYAGFLCKRTFTKSRYIGGCFHSAVLFMLELGRWRKMSEWIYVHDSFPENGLPEETGNYLIFYKGEVMMAHYFARSDYWAYGYHSNRAYDVTHWMPLPEPPK